MVSTYNFHYRYSRAKAIRDSLWTSPTKKPNSPLPTKYNANATGKHTETAAKYTLRRDKEKFLSQFPGMLSFA
jgi:hypothetical protein